MKEPIDAELFNSDECRAYSITTRSSTPVLAMCRALIDAGHDGGRPLHCCRGNVLALTVRSIGEGAKLRMATNSVGRPVFRREETRATASPMRQTSEAAE